jgi:hypothetical protein
VLAVVVDLFDTDVFGIDNALALAATQRPGDELTIRVRPGLITLGKSIKVDVPIAFIGDGDVSNAPAFACSNLT